MTATPHYLTFLACSLFLVRCNKQLDEMRKFANNNRCSSGNHKFYLLSLLVKLLLVQWLNYNDMRKKFALQFFFYNYVAGTTFVFSQGFWFLVDFWCCNPMEFVVKKEPGFSWFVCALSTDLKLLCCYLFGKVMVGKEKVKEIIFLMVYIGFLKCSVLLYW